MRFGIFWKNSAIGKNDGIRTAELMGRFIDRKPCRGLAECVLVLHEPPKNRFNSPKIESERTNIHKILGTHPKSLHVAISDCMRGVRNESYGGMLHLQLRRVVTKIFEIEEEYWAERQLPHFCRLMTHGANTLAALSTKSANARRYV